MARLTSDDIFILLMPSTTETAHNTTMITLTLAVQQMQVKGEVKFMSPTTGSGLGLCWTF